MAMAARALPMKRRLSTQDANPAGRVLITLSDSDSESESSSDAPPTKRRKSDTPSERASQPPRDRSLPAKPRHRLRSPAPALSRASQTNGLLPKRVAPKGREPQKSVPDTRIVDLTADSSLSPPRTSIPPLPSRRSHLSTTPFTNRVKDVRQAHILKSPFGDSREDTIQQQHRSHGDTIPSRSAAVSVRARLVGDDSQSSVPSRSPSRNHGPTSSQKSVAQPHFSVVVPRMSPAMRQSFSASQEDSRPQPVVEIDILKRFQGPLPKSRAEREAERREVWSKLQQSTKLAHEDPALVEQYFGQTGFSDAFSVKDKEEHQFMQKAASRKNRKKVNRNEVNLEIESLARTVETLKLSTKIIHPSRTARAILTNQFDKVNPPLTFSNDVNTKRLHGKFQFVSQYTIGDKVKPAPPSSNTGCGCTDCSLPSCLCFTKKVQDSGGSHTAQLKTYTWRGDGIVVLSDGFLTRELDPTTHKYEVTECNEFCKCGPKCWNRVVGNGRTVPLEIFQTKKCGFGVRSSADIVRGQFIELYLGEIITEAELRRREAAVSEDDPSYIYSLDWFTGINNTAHHVDGKYFGSAMRFVNHSCDPNARCFPVQIHKEDRKVYYLAFFAVRDIQAGVEIRIDYHSEGTLSRSSQDDADYPEPGDGGQLSEDLSKCYCGEKNCRGILWTPGVKARQRRRHKE